MARKLTKKEKAFADKYIETGNGTKSALEVYDTDDYHTAGVIAHENLKKPKIIQYFEDKSAVIASHIFKLALGAESEQVQLSAGKDILDRAGYKPTDKIDQTLNHVIVDDEAKRLADEVIGRYINKKNKKK